ncbi:hypothetical protein RJ639_028021 [Escallonia herrerae]|uniref:CBM-cenC domain-containing protein n=1 Tax=Escallonia herrerae TaxID=1293975 RepID=A0AA88XGZ0_9ASTE|nr:hypothetical protein RJ639_028021 [Escallonia herrerae]
MILCPSQIANESEEDEGSLTLREIQGVVILWVENGRAGFESIASNGDGGHPASNDAVPLEHPDFANTGRIVGLGVKAEEVGYGGAGNATADYTDGGGFRLSRVQKSCKEVRYGGGILVNPNFNCGTKGWTAFGNGVLQERTAENGNRFIVVHNRTLPLNSLSQRVQLKKGKLYAFSAWVQISEGRERVAVVFKTSHGELVPGGSHSQARMLVLGQRARIQQFKYGLTICHCNHLQKSNGDPTKTKSISKVCHANKTVVGGASVTIKQGRSGFPFGCAMTRNVLKSNAYQKWFSSRFSITTFRNEMKWYSTETEQGHEKLHYPRCYGKIF